MSGHNVLVQPLQRILSMVGVSGEFVSVWK